MSVSPALHPRERAALRIAGTSARTRGWRRAVLIAAPIVAVVGATIGLSAQAALRAIAGQGVAPVAAPSRAPGASGSVPTAAGLASPAKGTTGTIVLPPEPVTQAVPILYGLGIVGARPFSTAGATMADRGRALDCLSTAIYYEAASESDDGQRAVAQVILNRVRHPAFPATVCGVVYQGSERTSGCQFSYACDGAMARIPSRTGMARATRIAAASLAGQVFAPVGLATHYHTYAVTPAWNRTLVMTDAIGAHFFHRWKGYWGTGSAFHQAYRGGEPVPGPHPRAAPPTLVPVIIAAAVPITVPATLPETIQPGHAASGLPLVAITPDRAPESQILDRWRESGQPIR